MFKDVDEGQQTDGCIDGWMDGLLDEGAWLYFKLAYVHKFI